MLARILISGIFVGSNFLASFIVILIIVNSNSLELQSEFFLFQSLFFPLITAVAQLNILRNYRTGENGYSFRLDLTIILIFSVLFLLLRGDGNVVSTLFYALSVPLSVRASVMQAEAQFIIQRAYVITIPIIAAVVRVAFVYLLKDDLEPSRLFFINAFSLVVLVWVAYTFLKKNLRDIPVLKKAKDSFNPTFMFAFIMISSLFFQWDRYIFSLADQKTLIVQSGIYITLVLPPISMLFAMIFRGNATQIFRGQGGKNRTRMILMSGTLFAIPAIIYAVLLGLLWGYVPLLFPDATGMSPYPAIIMIIALILERLGNLIVYSREGQTHLAGATVVKLLCLLVAVLSTMLLFTRNVEVMYHHYMIASLVFFMVCFLVSWNSK